MMMNELKRQHIAAIPIQSAKGVWQIAVPFAIVALLQQMLFYFFIALCALIVISTVFSWLSWFKFRYRLEAGELYVERGVFVKKKRYIQKKRVQAIHISAGLWQRLFGLVKVSIDTAGGGMEAEAEFVAVTRAEAVRIRAELLKELKEEESGQNDGELNEAQNEIETEAVTETKPLAVWHLGTRRLIYAALTSSGIGLVISAVAAVLSQVGQFIPDDIYENTYDYVIGLSLFLLLILAVAVLLLSWIISSVLTILTYGNFNVSTYEKEMVIERGLIEKRQLTLAYRRITAVRIIKSIIRQPFGFVSVYVESAGGGTNKEQGSTLLVPLIHERDLPAFLEQTLPEYVFERPIESAPKRAAIRFFLRMLIVPVIATCIASYFFGAIGLIGGMGVAAIAALFAWLQYRDAGAGSNDTFIWLRSRTIGQTLVISPKQKVQSVTKRVSFLQKRSKLAHFEMFVQSSLAGKSFYVPNVSDENADALFQWYSHQQTE
ncbi:MAG: PH domain-containing protein [Shouchella clausii]|jgi:putative membrane protein